jgi:hypothetical protein
MKFTMSEQVINEILGFLGEQPYTKVAQIIAKIRVDAKPVVEEKVDAKPVVEEKCDCSEPEVKELKEDVEEPGNEETD